MRFHEIYRNVVQMFPDKERFDKLFLEQVDTSRKQVRYNLYLVRLGP